MTPQSLESRTPFSLDHHCYSEVDGKIDRRIYSFLMKEGLAQNAWIVRVQLQDLNSFHKWGDQYTKECLGRIKKKGLLISICKTHSGYIFLLPALSRWIPEPKALDGRR